MTCLRTVLPIAPFHTYITLEIHKLFVHTTSYIIFGLTELGKDESHIGKWYSESMSFTRVDSSKSTSKLMQLNYVSVVQSVKNIQLTGETFFTARNAASHLTN